MPFDTGRPHRRYNPLLGDWVLVSPHRTLRPWLGQKEPPPQPKTDATGCYLCPGNPRSGGQVNPHYTGPFAFDNDFAALSPIDGSDTLTDGLFRAEQESGLCRVLCYSPDHHRHLADLSPEEVAAVIQLWTEQYMELGSRNDIGWVQIFENRGEMMGASNPHPHGQVWASRTLPTIPARMQPKLLSYLQTHGEPLLGALAREEVRRRERIVFENDTWLAFVPYWAVWPFETMLLPKRPVTSLPELQAAEVSGLSFILGKLIRTYDQVFGVPFPYSMGLYQAPTDNATHPEWTLHFSFAPPLLRSATVRKFMVGYELFAGVQRDITPETAAERLREAAAQHL